MGASKCHRLWLKLVEEELGVKLTTGNYSGSVSGSWLSRLGREVGSGYGVSHDGVRR